MPCSYAAWFPAQRFRRGAMTMSIPIGQRGELVPRPLAFPTISAWLESEVAARGLSQAAASRAAGLPPSTVWAITHGRRLRPAPKILAALAGAFDVELGDLLA